MRTKALLGAAILAAGLATSMAQNVYSLNVVGYYNIPVPANTYVMVANQLGTTNNTLGGILPSVPGGSVFQKFGAGWSAYVFDDADLVWTPNATATLKPGEGGFFKSPVATTLTFVGEVPQGSLTNDLPKGLYTVVGSQVPQSGSATALGIPGEGGDIIQKWGGTAWSAFVFDDADLVWTPTVPNFNVGEAFFYKKAGNNTKWVRNFTVPQ